ncbi:hypothetical protein XELAEV_18030037mg [Xenopus laevis]|uniref:Uncharacterized protein n=1 Tax=Xenopus laevis TaxID=8355 RepID=A0A974HIC6_XENLA|nr:hypothetical protein XELAEV_18030037mg [Xenopus laevis]
MNNRRQELELGEVRRVTEVGCNESGVCSLPVTLPFFLSVTAHVQSLVRAHGGAQWPAGLPIGLLPGNVNWEKTNILEGRYFFTEKSFLPTTSPCSPPSIAITLPSLLSAMAHARLGRGAHFAVAVWVAGLATMGKVVIGTL